MAHTRTAPATVQQLIAAEPEPPSLPHVYRQPALTSVRREQADVDALSRQWTRACLRRETARAATVREALEREWTPLMQWAIDSWDYLLTTEGCRFLLRKPGEQWNAHGDYRACERSDYHRLVVHTFRACLARFVEATTDLPLTTYLVQELWPSVRATYQRLSQPPDRRQRLLTAYSYLRCVPYQFFNGCHQSLVHRTLQCLPPAERGVINLYYLHFFTEEAVAEAASIRPSTMQAYQRRALQHIAHAAPLTYALLLQIARY